MLVAAVLVGVAVADPIVGTWEGTSLCQVKSSPCRDEHVLYRFSSEQPRRYRVDAYKLIAGRQVFMGPIDVMFDRATGQLDGAVVSGTRSTGKLRLVLKAGHMSGSIVLSDGTLYRLIEVDKH